MSDCWLKFFLYVLFILTQTHSFKQMQATAGDSNQPVLMKL